METKSRRKPSMDIIRCFAFFFVVSVHFFLHNGFYDCTIDGPRMYIMTVMRSFFMICVPLFIMLTGYLMSEKKLNRAYYGKLGYTISIYVLVSICCVLFKVFYQKQDISFYDFVRGFFNFTNAPYSWYVEMYIGLFLLCPFLNVLYGNLKTREEKQILLVTFLLLTALPYVANIFVPKMDWIMNPTSSSDYFELLPNYWTGLYPITYYYLGCYLKENKLPIKTGSNVILLIVFAIINGSFNYYRSHNSLFVEGPWQQYGSLFTVIQTVLFFTLFDNLDYNNFPKMASCWLQKISSLCFGGYLLSWIFDLLFYEILNEKVPTMPVRLNYYVLVVPCVFVCSLALSYVIEQIYVLLRHYLGRKIR